MNGEWNVWGPNHRMVAQRLGLIVDDGEHIHGVLDRIPIAITHARPTERDRVVHDCIYSAILPTPSPIWFNLAEKTIHEKLGSFFRGLVSKPSGHDEFDKRFEIHGEDPVQVTNMFDEDARAAVFMLADQHFHPLITTQMLSLRVFAGVNANPEHIEQALLALVRSSQTLGRTFSVASMGPGYR